MRIDNKRDMDIRYYLFVIAVVGAYSLYLLSFTLFDGFSTFSNDAANYVLMARKWSPFFQPTPAELFTWPVHPYPPAFAWLLAITGASESLWASHLVVSLCMVAGILVMGYYVCQQTNQLIAGVMTVAICLTPGIVIHSLGILPENLYLLVSLGALVVYAHIRNRPDVSWTWYLVLFLLLAAAILSRTVGIALIAAFVAAPILDRKLNSRQRVILPLLALASIVAWQVWEAVRPGEFELSYGLYLSGILGRESVFDMIVPLWQIVTRNLVKMLGSWSQYFALSSIAAPSFLITYLLFIICAISLILRVVRLKLDAVYVVFYIGIILLYPWSEQMTRFLHPIAFLILVQPVFYLSERGYLAARSRASYAVVGAGLILIVHSAAIQFGLLGSRTGADDDFPQLRHSPEYYLATPENNLDDRALAYAWIAELMAGSIERIPSDSVVASDKHDNYALLTDRRALPLSSWVSLNQQLCNLQVKDVDFVFLAGFASTLNLKGLTLYRDYEKLASQIWSMATMDGTQVAYLLQIDQSALAAELDSSGFSCERFRIAN